MSTVRKYPSTYNNVDSWIYPQNITGQEDGLCGNKVVQLEVAEKKCFMTGWGFQIPTDATISKVAMNSKGSLYRLGGTGPGDAGFKLQKGGWLFINSNGNHVGVCSASMYGSPDLDCTVADWSVNDLNSENFTAWVYVECASLQSGFRGYIDACYIEVTYTLPSGARGFGDGLTWVTRMLALIGFTPGIHSFCVPFG